MNNNTMVTTATDYKYRALQEQDLELLKSRFFYDSFDGTFISKRSGKKVGTDDSDQITFAMITDDGTTRITALARRAVFLWEKGYLPKVIKVVDGDYLNNRIDNLYDSTPKKAKAQGYSTTKTTDFSILTELLRFDSQGQVVYRISGKPLTSTASHSGYRSVSLSNGAGHRSKTSMHRLVFLLANGYLPKLVDHINRDKTNNHPDNLRAATLELNATNSADYSNNTSGRRGVSRTSTKDNSRWRASITVAGKRLTRQFITRKEAIAQRFAWEKEFQAGIRFNERTGALI